MAINQPRRTLNRIYAVSNHKGGVTKTTTNAHLAHGLSRQLLVPAEHPDENETVTLNRKSYRVMGRILLVDLAPKGNCAQALNMQPNRANVGEFLIDRQSIREAMGSADSAKQGVPHPKRWLPPTSNNLAVANIDHINHHFAHAIIGNGNRKNSLTSQLTDKLGSIADRFAFIISDCPPTLDALSRSIYHLADTAIVPVKSDTLSTSGADRHVNDVRQTRTARIDIKLHTIVLIFFISQQQLFYRAMLRRQKRWYGGNTVAELVPRNKKVAEAPVSNGFTLFEFDTWYESPAIHAYEKLVERIYDG